MFKNSKTHYIKQFFFPFWPLKSFRSIIIICIMAAAIGLGIGLNYLSIPIPAIGVRLSFTWLPTMVIGWFFGPLVGLAFGFLIDTVVWLINGGVWFWLYAIQEPILGLMAGCIGSVCRLSISQKWNLKISLIINQLVLLSFMAVCIVVMFVYTDPNSPLYDKLVSSNQIPLKFNEIYRYIILAVLLVFLIILETIIFINYLKKTKDEKQNKKYLYFLYGMLVAVLSTMIFSFLLGPISTIKFYEFLHNKTPPNLLKFGAVYYLLPRIIKECIKTPIYISILSLLIMSLRPMMDRVKSLAYNTYQYDSH